MPIGTVSNMNFDVPLRYSGIEVMKVEAAHRISLSKFISRWKKVMWYFSMSHCAQRLASVMGHGS